MSYLDYLKEKKNEPYWQEILNTSFDFLDHKLELLNSEILKNNYELKKQTIENLNDHIASHEMSLKLINDFEKITSLTENALNTLEEEIQPLNYNNNNSIKIKEHYFEFNYCLDFQNIVKKKIEQDKYDEIFNILIFIHEKDQKNKISNYYDNIVNKIKILIFEKFSNLNSKKNKIDENFFKILNFFHENQKFSLQELLTQELNKKFEQKIAKLKPYKGNDDYLTKILYVFMKSFSNNYSKFQFFFEDLIKNDKSTIDQLFIKYLKSFRKILKILMKKYNQDESCLKFLFCVKNECFNKILLKYFNEIYEKIIMKNINIFSSKLFSFSKYCCLNNSLNILNKKIDGNFFIDLNNLFENEQEEKLEKLGILIKKGEIFYVLYINLLILHQYLNKFLTKEEEQVIYDTILRKEIIKFENNLIECYEVKKFLKTEEKIKIKEKFDNFISFLDLFYNYIIKNK